MSAREITVEWHGITLLLVYTPKRPLPVDHIAIHLIAPAGASIRLTDTGYRSHFTYDDIESYGGPAEYVTALLEEAASSPEWKLQQLEARQMGSF